MIQPFFLLLVISILLKASLATICAEVTLDGQCFFVVDAHQIPTYQQVKKAGEKIPQNLLLCHDPNTYQPPPESKMTNLKVYSVSNEHEVIYRTSDQKGPNDFASSNIKHGHGYMRIPKYSKAWVVAVTSPIDKGKVDPSQKLLPLNSETCRKVLETFQKNPEVFYHETTLGEEEELKMKPKEAGANTAFDDVKMIPEDSKEKTDLTSLVQIPTYHHSNVKS